MIHRLLLATLALCASHAMAQDVRLYSQSEAVNPQDVARILDQSKPAFKMRSLRLLDDGPAAKPYQSEQVATAGDAAAPAGASAEPARPAALALPVQFKFDSAEILPSARQQLDALAEGIRLLPATQRVVIEGHTDAVGSPHYNEQLSERRAYSVKHYLVAVHGIAPERLQAVGLGAYGLLPGRAPYAPENRRVQFRGG
ncbi:MAG TPA: OmpA family protein [Albitalea sp.]|nr:OmpA family protein [Albitalea sp.]